MTDWSQLTPPSQIKEIEGQRRRVLDLRAQIPTRREQREAASARVVDLERQDRQRKSEAMVAGKAVTSDVEQIEQARAEAADAVRTTEALTLAIEAAEQDLHALVLKHRDAWTKRAEHDVVETRADAQTALSALQSALERHRQAQAVHAWLAPDGRGLDREGRVRSVLGPAPGSDRLTANSLPIDLSVVFGWLGAALAEPAAQDEQPHSRDQWPATGPAVIGGS